MCPKPSANPRFAMNSKPLSPGCARPKLCLGVLSSSRFVNLVDCCLFVRSSLIPRSRDVGSRVIFGVAIDSEVALNGLASCFVRNASMLPISTSFVSAIAVVQTPGITRNVSPSEDRPSFKSQGDSCQEQQLTPASIRTPFLCPAKGPRARRFSSRHEKFPRRP